MGSSPQAERLRVEVTPGGSGRANLDTGFPVLDHLLGAARRVRPVRPRRRARSRRVGRRRRRRRRRARRGVLASTCAPRTRAATAPASCPVDEALAHVVLEVSERPVLASNVDLSEARVGGLGTDLVTGFLRRLAEGAGVTLHVRLIAGDDAQHVLEAMFKALGRRADARLPPDLERRHRGREGSSPHRGGARAVPGRAVLAGDQGRRARVRLRPARADARLARARGRRDRRADRAGVREPEGDPGGGRDRASTAS